MAAQPIVSASYENPVETFDTNVMGTVNFLEACRTARTPTVIVVSSDKCYKNPEDGVPFKVGAPLGGKDPYSASKAGTELVVESWRYAFFDPAGTTRLASARAGNVIGGGDWSDNRLLPDAARAFSKGEKLEIRSPLSTRPWQHVLEPVIGYLQLAEELSTDQSHGRAWNFGPHPPVAVPVKDVADFATAFWPGSPGWDCPEGALEGFGEAKSLLLDCEDTIRKLGWMPSLSVETAVQWTMRWYREFYERGPEAARAMTMAQIDEYVADGR
jgi:CDP-glucose 4,6-dehydratase